MNLQNQDAGKTTPLQKIRAHGIGPPQINDSLLDELKMDPIFWLRSAIWGIE